MSFRKAGLVIPILMCISWGLGSAERAKVELFVMSQCPYGVRALESIKPVIDRADIDFSLHFIADIDTTLPYGFSSLHGTQEVEEDMRWLVIMKYYPNKFWDYFASRATHFSDANWQNDAYIAGINPDTLHMLVETEGASLLRENIKRSHELLCDSSPTIYVNGVKYNWDRTAPSLVAVANRFSTNKVAGIPECFTDNDCFSTDKAQIGKCGSEGKCVFTKAQRTNLIIVRGDTTYTDSVAFLKTVKNFDENIPGLQTKILYYTSDEAKKLKKKLDIKELPAFIFDETIEKSDLFSRMKESGFLKDKVDKYYRVNPRFIQTEFYTEREAIPRRLDIFLSLDCPAGHSTLVSFANILNSKALAKTSQVMRGKKYSLVGLSSTPQVASTESSGTTMKGKKYTLISSQSTTTPAGTTPTSLPPAVWVHFIPKVDTTTNRFTDRPEIISEMKLLLTAEKNYPEKFWDFVSCRMESPLGDWQVCAKQAGIPADSLSALISKEGDNLLLQDLKVKEALRIDFSPTFLYENKYRFLSTSILQKIDGLENLNLSLKGGCR